MSPATGSNSTRPNVTRVLLSEDVSELVARQADQTEAYNILNAAVDKQEEGGPPMTLEEALTYIGEVHRYVEALGQ